MKKLLMILATLLLFSSTYSVNNEGDGSKEKDTLRIRFNGKTFIKEFPKTYNEAVSTIESMRYLFDSFDSVYNSMVKSNEFMKNELIEYTDNVKTYSDSILVLSDSIINLNDTIKQKSDEIKDNTKIYVDSLNYLVNKIEKKPISNLGVKISVASNFQNNNQLVDYTVTPMFVYKKLLLGVDLGVYSGSNLSQLNKRFGLGVGYFLK